MAGSNDLRRAGTGYRGASFCLLGNLIRAVDPAINSISILEVGAS
jgi:hypothetical protein